MISIDGQPFDPAVEHFSFRGLHRISDTAELAKLREFSIPTSASFHATGLDDVGLGYVTKVRTIENLNPQDTKVSDEGLIALKRLPNLRHLRLKENPHLSNACIPHLLKLGRLEDLQIQETSIDMAGLEQVVDMGTLTDICLDVWRDN